MDATLVAAGLNLLSTVLTIIRAAIAGDRSSQERLRRVEEVLKDSPMERAWADALERAKRKPSAVPVGDVPVVLDPPANPFTDDEG
jgi:hypothetical protein